VGTFERSGRLAALWAGVERGEALERLQGKIEAALRRAGFEPERRRYQPHVTLARLDHAPPERVGAFVQRHNLFRADPFRVEAFALFSSHPGRDHAEYVAEAEYPLAG
jgi:2'-5' RNA ligase